MWKISIKTNYVSVDVPNEFSLTYSIILQFVGEKSKLINNLLHILDKRFRQKALAK